MAKSNSKSKLFETQVDEEMIKKCDLFLKKIKSDMHYTSNYSGDLMTFDWVDVIEQACPFIDNVIRHPKLILIQEENVVKIEKSKKITVASVKDLSRHTNFISKVNKKTKDVEPSKILDIRNEETFNIYENRFLYTLLDSLNRFLMKKEELLDNFQIKDDKVLEYIASTVTDSEKVSVEVRLTSSSLPKEVKDKSIEEEIIKVKERIRRIREYFTSWEKSEMYKALEKAHISLVIPPIKKTNIILKNPNFQVAVNLWNFLQTYDYVDNDSSSDGMENDGDDKLKGFLDHSFLIDFFIMDSISKTKKEQKQKLSEYAILMITKEVYRTVSLLLDSGVDITDDDLLQLISKEIKNERNNRLIGADDVKKKFKNAMDEYLERTQDYL